MRFSALPESRKNSINEGGRREIKVHAKSDGHRGKPSMTQARRLEKHQAINTAKRKLAVKGNVEKPQVPIRVSPPFVFVGNLKSGITVPRLKALFESCGEVLDITIRCSRGKVTTFAGRTQEDPINFRDLWYATIVFRALSAAKKALELTGSEIDGRKIVVCKTAGELPEVLDFAHIRFGKNQERRGMVNQYQPKPKRLSPEPTLVDNPDDRHNVFGISFAKCVC